MLNVHHHWYITMVTMLGNIREAKAQKDAAQKEYEQDEKRARAQEDAIRQVNQKMADKAMTVNIKVLAY